MSSSAAVSSMVRPLKVGLVGGGTVGGGVYEILMGRLVDEENKQRRPIVVSKVCVRDLSKPRSFHLRDDHSAFVTDVKSILEDDDIELVVEVMGGTGVAKTLVLEALERNKSVVTANKALIAEHLTEIQSAVAKSKGNFAYEAAVCGGIPIISTLQTCYTGDVIHEVMGICNGTTNYMLAKMQEGKDYGDVLKQAQALGFAEADPTADVEGHDVRAKICILAKLAFGTTISDVESIPCRGITEISTVDFEYAKLLNCTIKLVGTAARLSKYGEHDGPISVYVAPKMVPLSHLLATARGSGNSVAITSANMNTCAYSGPGAGRFPTANSVVADVVRMASTEGKQQDPFGPETEQLDLDHDYSSAFYVRIPFMDSLGIIRKIGELAENNGVSIHSILQNPIVDRMAADFVVTTEPCKLSQVDALCQDIDQQDFARSNALYMPLLIDY